MSQIHYRFKNVSKAEDPIEFYAWRSIKNDAVVKIEASKLRNIIVTQIKKRCQEKNERELYNCVVFTYFNLYPRGKKEKKSQGGSIQSSISRWLFLSFLTTLMGERERKKKEID